MKVLINLVCPRRLKIQVKVRLARKMTSRLRGVVKVFHYPYGTSVLEEVVVNITPQPLYPRKETGYPLYVC
jgi:hypothetical protein